MVQCGLSVQFAASLQLQTKGSLSSNTRKTNGGDEDFERTESATRLVSYDPSLAADKFEMVSSSLKRK